MTRTAAERRHHRARVIRNRQKMTNIVWKWHAAGEQPGRLAKKPPRAGWWHVRGHGGRYRVKGIDPTWRDDDPSTSTRQILKQDTRRQMLEALS